MIIDYKKRKTVTIFVVCDKNITNSPFLLYKSYNKSNVRICQEQVLHLPNIEPFTLHILNQRILTTSIVIFFTLILLININLVVNISFFSLILKEYGYVNH